MEKGVLTATCLTGSGLRDIRLLGNMHTFCVLECAGRTQRTRTDREHGRFPCWKFGVRFPATAADTLVVTVIDDQLAKNAEVGSGAVPVSVVASSPGGRLEQEVPLFFRNAAAGSVALILVWSPEGGAAPPSISNAPSSASLTARAPAEPSPPESPAAAATTTATATAAAAVADGAFDPPTGHAFAPPHLAHAPHMPPLLPTPSPSPPLPPPPVPPRPAFAATPLPFAPPPPPLAPSSSLGSSGPPSWPAQAAAAMLPAGVALPSSQAGVVRTLHARPHHSTLPAPCLGLSPGSPRVLMLLVDGAASMLLPVSPTDSRLRAEAAFGVLTSFLRHISARTGSSTGLRSVAVAAGGSAKDVGYLRQHDGAALWQSLLWTGEHFVSNGWATLAGLFRAECGGGSSGFNVPPPPPLVALLVTDGAPADEPAMEAVRGRTIASLFIHLCFCVFPFFQNNSPPPPPCPQALSGCLPPGQCRLLVAVFGDPASAQHAGAWDAWCRLAARNPALRVLSFAGEPSDHAAADSIARVMLY